MQILLTLILAMVVLGLGIRLVCMLLGFIFRLFLGAVKLAFVAACVLSFLYLATQFLPAL